MPKSKQKNSEIQKPHTAVIVSTAPTHSGMDTTIAGKAKREKLE